MVESEEYASTPELLEALADVCAGRLTRHGLYMQVPPTVFFAATSDELQETLRAISIFVFHGGKIQQIKQPGDQLDLHRLVGCTTLWIRETELPLVNTLVEKLLIGEENVNAPVLPQAVRAETLRRSASMAVDELLKNPTRENVEKSTKVVGLFVEMMMKDPQTFFVLSRLSSHDPYTLQHSIGTAVNSIMLSKKSGILTPAELNEVGAAGLLHDIGKVKINRAIINKNGPLDKEEWEEMKQHPLLGYEMVKDDPTISETTRRAILEHHEDNAGTGYPRKLKREQRHRVSNIVSICDVFNALTTDRSYSKAKTVFEALELMRDKLGRKIDADLFTHLVMIYGGKL
jgi:HD-GYP domain-containing protein (c-di-GMP phosphodiesterase class II)